MKQLCSWGLALSLILANYAEAYPGSRRSFLKKAALVCSALILQERGAKASAEPTSAMTHFRKLKFIDESHPEFESRGKLSEFETGLELIALNVVDLLREIKWLETQPSSSKLDWLTSRNASREAYEAFRWSAWRKIQTEAQKQLAGQNSPSTFNLTVPFAFERQDENALLIAPSFEVELSGDRMTGSTEAHIISISLVTEKESRPATMQYRIVSKEDRGPVASDALIRLD